MTVLLAAALLLLVGQTPASAGRIWQGFRGDGSSRASARNVPVRWSADENVAWQVDLPGYGYHAAPGAR
jgi:hypothetical protein